MGDAEHDYRAYLDPKKRCNPLVPIGMGAAYGTTKTSPHYLFTRAPLFISTQAYAVKKTSTLVSSDSNSAQGGR